MIKIFLWQEAGRIVGVSISGHAGYAEAGSDIVCAAVSGACELLSAMMDAAKVPYQSYVKEETASLAIFAKAEGAKALYEGFAAYAKSLQRRYPEYIRVTEVQYAEHRTAILRS